MTEDYIGLGCCPYMEETENTSRYAGMLRKIFPDVKIKIYDGEVCMFFDPENEEEVRRAFYIDANLPKYWK